MKVAITVQGTRLQDPIDPRFGRARAFVIADTETGITEARDNAVNLNTAQGAGVQAGQQIAQAGVSAVITGHVGPKAFRTLDAAGIEIYLATSGTAAEAWQRFLRKELPRQTTAHVEDHG